MPDLAHWPGPSAADVLAHAGDTTGVHGIPDTLELVDEAELAAELASFQTAAQLNAAIAAHAGDATAVHGITDTADLALKSRLPAIDVRDFGLDPAGIQAGILTAVAEGLPLGLPPQLIEVDVPLRYENGLTLVGVPGKTILREAPGGLDSILGGSLLNGPGITGDPITDLTLIGITFDGANIAGGAGLVHAYASQGLRASLCDFINGGNYGLALQGLPFSLDALKQGPHNDTLLFGCRFLNNVSGGADVKSCDVFRVFGGLAGGNDDIGLDVRGRGVLLVGFNATGNTQAGIAVRSHADGQLLISADVLGCRSWGNGSGLHLGSSGSAGRDRVFRITVEGGEYRDNLTPTGAGIIAPAVTNPANTKMHLAVKGAHAYGNVGDGIRAQFATTLAILANHIESNLGRGVNLEDILRARVSANHVEGHTGSGMAGVRMAGTSDFNIVVGNVVRGNTTNITGAGAGNVVQDNVTT
jgi:Periplasmic copper-binding protein (NosD)